MNITFILIPFLLVLAVFLCGLILAASVNGKKGVLQIFQFVLSHKLLGVLILFTTMFIGYFFMTAWKNESSVKPVPTVDTSNKIVIEESKPETSQDAKNEKRDLEDARERSKAIQKEASDLFKSK